MEYTMYRLKFQTAVHFGRHNLDEGEYTCCADTIFSALCHEALRLGEHVFQKFYHDAKDGKLLLTDAFPYIGETCFLPKPIKRIESGRQNGDSTIKKAFKKLKYIPAELLDTYLRGNFDILNAPDFDTFGTFEMKTAASVRGETETVPYRIGTYYYNAGNGLYLIIGYQEKKGLALVEELLEGLSFSGLGGKRAAGFGRFTFDQKKVPEELSNRLKGTGAGYMSLSVALPTATELACALQGAEYLLSRRSGFVSSENYAAEQMRKKDLYVFKSGSCFATRFCGDIYDVSDGGRHPVYRYAKPMLMEV